MGNCRSKRARKFRNRFSLKRRSNSSLNDSTIANPVRQIFAQGGQLQVTGCQISSFAAFPVEIKCTSTAEGANFSVIVEVDDQLPLYQFADSEPDDLFRVKHAVWSLETGQLHMGCCMAYSARQAVTFDRPFSVKLAYDLLAQSLHCSINDVQVFETTILGDNGIDEVRVNGEVRETKRALSKTACGQLSYEIQCKFDSIFDNKSHNCA